MCVTRVPRVGCEFRVFAGIGDEAYFYVENVFFINGVNMALFFIFATYLRCVASRRDVVL